MDNIPPPSQGNEMFPVAPTRKRKLSHDAERPQSDPVKSQRTIPTSMTTISTTPRTIVTDHLATSELDPALVLNNQKDPFLGENVEASADKITFANRPPGEIITAEKIGMLDRNRREQWDPEGCNTDELIWLFYTVHHRVTDTQYRLHIEFRQTPIYVRMGRQDYILLEDYIAMDQTQNQSLRRQIEERGWYHQQQKQMHYHVSTYQRDVKEFFTTGILSNRIMFGRKRFGAASPIQRETIWNYIFDRAPIQITKRMLGIPGNIIDIDEIFLGDNTDTDRRREKLINCLRSMFVQACEYMVLIVKRKGPGKLSRHDNEKWYKQWRDLPKSGEWKQRVGSSRYVWNLASMPINVANLPINKAKLHQSSTERVR